MTRTIAIASAGLAVLALSGDVSHPWRALLLAPFLLVGPGLAWTPHLVLDDLGTELVVAGAVTLALHSLTATALASFDAWTPAAAMGLTLVIAAAGVVLTDLRTHRTVRP